MPTNVWSVERTPKLTRAPSSRRGAVLEVDAVTRRGAVLELDAVPSFTAVADRVTSVVVPCGTTAGPTVRSSATFWERKRRPPNTASSSAPSE
jgi:hypothetical protein